MGWCWWSTYSDEEGLFMTLVIGPSWDIFLYELSVVGRILLFWGYLRQELWQRVPGVVFLLQISGWCY